MTSYPTPEPGCGAGANSFTPDLEHRTLWWLRCTGAMRADYLSGGL